MSADVDLAVVMLEFDMPADPLNLNRRRVIGDVAPWRDAAFYAWCKAHPGAGPSGRVFAGPAEVWTVLPTFATRRRDPINYAPTVKALVDGLVLAGAWPDDTPDYVTQHLPTFRPATCASDRLALIRVRERPEGRP